MGQLRRSFFFEHEMIGYRRAVTTGPSTGWRSSARGVRTGSQNHNPVSGAPTSFVAPLIFSLQQAHTGVRAALSCDMLAP